VRELMNETCENKEIIFCINYFSIQGKKNLQHFKKHFLLVGGVAKPFMKYLSRLN
jgi:hypothetical protein